MEKNHITGFILLFATLFAWTYFSAPDKAEMEKRQRTQDSLLTVEMHRDSLNQSLLENNTSTGEKESEPQLIPDSLRLLQNASLFGPFAPSSVGKEETFTLENEKIKITFSSKGGKIESAAIKEYTVSTDDRLQDPDKPKDRTALVELLNDERNKFEYQIPIANVPSGSVSTADLFFNGSKNGNELTLTAKSNTGAEFKQIYALSDGYKIDYKVQFDGLSNIVSGGANIMLNWENYLHSYEKNENFERNYSAIYFKKTDKGVDDCGCMSADDEVIDNKTIDWVSHSNQYFNSSLMAKGSPFISGFVASEVPEEGVDFMEKLTTKLEIPIAGNSFDMSMYLGPNEYDNLKAFDVSLENIIPFGSSIFGTINKYFVRPVFSLFNGWLGSLGLAIIVIIFLIKMALYPLMYKMLHSQALMGALKPQLAHLTEKYKDDAQQKQLETMKVYREYGVSPLGGCLPMIVQMPIWYALFRFFPASILFRQESFLWAMDLSSYDDFFHLGFEIPFVGTHLSLFTILYSISMLIYTYYNTRHMDMSANPAMKYMQYFMPVMFFGFFNTYASALTCYMFFSNIINILQTVITKKFVFSDDKLKQELKVKKAKPKKEGGFRSKFEEALKQQQAAQAAQSNKSGKGKKKK